MTATTIKSDNITNIESSVSTITHKKNGLVNVVIDQDEIGTASLNEDGDQWLLAPIPSDAVILDIEYLADELDSHATPTLDVNVGLAYSGIGGTQLADNRSSGELISEACFASDMHIAHDAAITWTSVRFEADDIVDVQKEAWSVGGLTSDPGGLFYLSFTVGTNAAATGSAGSFAVKVTYI